ncbi:MAG: hypothetical protein QMD92_00240 [bacterium]|nr:hypothetical protein [bacterium]
MGQLSENFDIRTPEIKMIIEACVGNTKMTSRVMFPDRFTLPFSKMHDQLFNVLDDDLKQQVVIAAPRGFGKTSIGMSYQAGKIIFREKKFIIPCSATASQALLQGENLKRELLSNTIIGRLFGPMKSSMFSQDQWITETGTMVMPRGSGQQIRGLLFGNYRPDLILLDDIEDSESVKSEEQRKKLKEWFFADVMNSVNRSRKDWKVVVVGTLLHEDSLLANLLDDKNWHPVQLELFDDDYHSNWQEFMTDEDVAKLVDAYRKQRMLGTLFREYRNLPVAKEDAKFKSEYFKYYTENQKKQVQETVVIMDPAKTVKATSDNSAAVGVGLDMVNHRILVLDVDSGNYHPDEFISKSLDMCKRLGARVLGYEETSLHEFISYPLENEMKKRGMNLDLVPLSARASKEERIASLIPFYRQGEVYHNATACGALESQLMSYPRAKRWDCMDALAYIVPLLEKGERYFFAKDEKAVEAEFATIENKEEDYEIPPDDGEFEGWRNI